MSRHSSARMKLALAGFMIAAIGGVFFLFAGYRSTPSEAALPVDKGVDMAIASIHHESTRDGVTEWRLDATSAHLMESMRMAVFQRPAITFFSKNDAPLRLVAKEGKVSTDSSDIRVSGDVVMDNGTYRLETASLDYHHGDRRFQSGEPVRVVSRDMELSADSASVDIHGRRAVFKGNVRGCFGEALGL